MDPAMSWVVSGIELHGRYRLTLAQPNFRFPQKPDDLLRRKSLPCHPLLSSVEVGNSRIRSVTLASDQGSRPPTGIVFNNDIKGT
jgi:hypothetical protein